MDDHGAAPAGAGSPRTAEPIDRHDPAVAAKSDYQWSAELGALIRSSRQSTMELLRVDGAWRPGCRTASLAMGDSATHLVGLVVTPASRHCERSSVVISDERARSVWSWAEERLEQLSLTELDQVDGKWVERHRPRGGSPGHGRSGTRAGGPGTCPAGSLGRLDLFESTFKIIRSLTDALSEAPASDRSTGEPLPIVHLACGARSACPTTTSGPDSAASRPRSPVALGARDRSLSSISPTRGHAEIEKMQSSAGARSLTGSQRDPGVQTGSRREKSSTNPYHVPVSKKRGPADRFSETGQWWWWW